MRAAYASSAFPDDPLAGLVIGERPEPEPPPGWTTVDVKAVSLNHHDLWTLRGVGIGADQFPMILGCDAAGVDTATGAEVIVHSVIPTEARSAEWRDLFFSATSTRGGPSTSPCGLRSGRR